MYEMFHRDLSERFGWTYIPYSPAPGEYDEMLVRACEYVSLLVFVEKRRGNPVLITEIQDKALEQYLKYYRGSK